MKERPFYLDLFNGRPISYKQVIEQTPNMSHALDQLMKDGDAVGQRCFEENGETDIIVFIPEKGGTPHGTRNDY